MARDHRTSPDRQLREDVTEQSMEKDSFVVPLLFLIGQSTSYEELVLFFFRVAFLYIFPLASFSRSPTHAPRCWVLPYLEVITNGRKSKNVASWTSRAAVTKGELPILLGKEVPN